MKKNLLLLTLSLFLISCGDSSNNELTNDEINSVLNPDPISRDSLNSVVQSSKSFIRGIFDGRTLGEQGKSIVKSELDATERILDQQLEVVSKDSVELVEHVRMLKQDFLLFRDSINAIQNVENIDYERISRSVKPSDSEIENLFSKWDGSLPTLKDEVKKHMHDPSSFEHIETGWKVLDDGLHIKMNYRGNNAFGNPVVNSIEVKTDFEGNLKQVISEN